LWLPHRFLGKVLSEWTAGEHGRTGGLVDRTQSLLAFRIHVSHATQIQGCGSFLDRRRQVFPGAAEFCRPGTGDASFELDGDGFRVLFNRYA
jgi:hypothetical protein